MASFGMADFTVTADPTSEHRAALTIAVIAHDKSADWSAEDRAEAKTILDSLGVLPDESTTT